MHRVGLIGCGWVAPFHLAGLARLSSRVQIVWVADPVRERADAIARQVGAHPLTDYREGLRDVDCAFVLVPHHLHHSITLDCLNACTRADHVNGLHLAGDPQHNVEHVWGRRKENPAS